MVQLRPISSLRRLVAVVVAAAATGALCAVPAAAQASELPGVLRSGLPWASGVYIPGKDPARHAAFADFRGAPTDVVVTWPARSSWSDLTNAGWMYRAWSSQPQTAVYGFPPIPEDGVSTLSACAAGAYNAHWRTIGQQLQATGAAHKTIIRLGWEFNGDWYDWAARTPSVFAECWRQVHRSADAQAPALRWDWNVNRGISQIGIDPRAAYPGDAYVDIVGIDSYDWYPGAIDEARWEEHYAGPQGLKHWADFARSRGKKLSVPEWGVYPGTAAAGRSGGDNPFYIRKMLGFFSEQRDNLAYEAYFNTDASYYAGSLFGPVQVPKASAEYAKLIRAYRTGAVATPVSAPAPSAVPAPAPTAPVVQLAAPTVQTTSDGAAVQAEVHVDRPVTFAKLLRVAVRDSAGRSTDSRGGLDMAFGPSTVSSTARLTGSRALAPDTYTAFVTYSIDGSTWVRGPATTFRVPEVASSRAKTTTVRTSPYKRIGRASGSR